MPEKTVNAYQRFILLRSRFVVISLCFALLLCSFVITASADGQNYMLFGTWRFNDVVTAQDGDSWQQDISFYFDFSDPNVLDGLPVRVYCSRMHLAWDNYDSDFNWLIYGLVGVEPSEVEANGAVYDVASEFAHVFSEVASGSFNVYKNAWMDDREQNGQTITIPNDTEVSAEFYEWFTANAVRISDEEIMENEGNKFVDEILDALPDPSTDVLAALKGLTDATAYTGTDAVLPIPAIVLPGIDGLFPETEIWGGTEMDFGEYISMLSPALLTLVQALFTIAIVLYCVYELKGIISYCLTLRESKGG